MTIENRHIKNAVCIAKTLLERADIQKDMILWDKNSNAIREDLFYKFDYSLSSGVSGVIYFYAELFNLTRDEQYLDIIHKSVNALQINLDKQSYFNFGIMNGITGVVFLFIKLYIVTNKIEYLSLAKKYCKIILDTIYSDNLNNSLFEGRAGALLVVLNLYLITGEEDSLNQLRKLLKKILVDASFDKDGLNWYYSQTQISGLVGFGYGSVGISYALSLLNKYISLRNYKLKNLMYGGFEYCKNRWNPITNNWPDYNLSINSAEDNYNLLKKFFNKEEKSNMFKGKDTFNFSDGFIGILYGLSFIVNRMKLDKSLINLIETSNLYINKVEGNFRDVLDFSALLSIKLMKGDEIESLYRTQQLNFQVNQLGLKDGLSGIGYLELIASRKIVNPYFSFLLESANNKTNSSKISFVSEKNYIKNLVLSPYLKHYPLTLNIIKNNHSRSILNKLYSQLPKVDYAFFCNVIDQVLDTKLNDEMLRTIYRYELQRQRFYQNNRNCAEIYLHNYTNFLLNRSLQKVRNNEILNKTLVLSKYCKIVDLNFNIKELLDNKNVINEYIIKKEKSYCLLQYSDKESYFTEEFLTELDQIMINFRKPVKVSFLLETVIKISGLENKRNLIKRRLITLIMKNIQSGTLISID